MRSKEEAYYEEEAHSKLGQLKKLKPLSSILALALLLASVFLPPFLTEPYASLMTIAFFAISSIFFLVQAAFEGRKIYKMFSEDQKMPPGFAASISLIALSAISTLSLTGILLFYPSLLATAVIPFMPTIIVGTLLIGRFLAALILEKSAKLDSLDPKDTRQSKLSLQQYIIFIFGGFFDENTYPPVHTPLAILGGFAIALLIPLLILQLIATYTTWLTPLALLWGGGVGTILAIPTPIFLILVTLLLTIVIARTNPKINPRPEDPCENEPTSVSESARAHPSYRPGQCDLPRDRQNPKEREEKMDSAASFISRDSHIPQGLPPQEENWGDTDDIEDDDASHASHSYFSHHSEG